MFRFVLKQFCLFRLFRYRFETPKQTESFCYWFHETNRNKLETDLVSVRTEIFFCLFWGPPSVLCTPRLCCRGRTDSPGGEGDGGSIFWKTREIGLPSYSKICTLWCEIRFFFALKRNEIFASISNFASEAKVRAHPWGILRGGPWNLYFLRHQWHSLRSLPFQDSKKVSISGPTSYNGSRNVCSSHQNHYVYRTIKTTGTLTVIKHLPTIL